MATRSSPHVAALLLLCAGFSLAAPRMVGAAPILFTGVVVNNGSCTPYVNCVITPGENDPGNIGVSGTGLVQISGTYGGASLSAAADASAGLLRTSASASYDLAAPGYRIAAAGAIVADTLTITAPGVADGTAGLLDLSITLDGTVATSGTGNAGTLAGVFWGGTAPLEDQAGQLFSTSTTTNTVYSVDVPFTYGDPFLLTLYLFSAAGTIGVCDQPMTCNPTEGTVPYLASGVGAGSADFFHTLLLSGLVPTINGVPVENPLFTANSGVEYTVNGVVPEPGTTMLLGSGLTLFLARWRRKRTR